jgi:hypothetical protein
MKFFVATDTNLTQAQSADARIPLFIIQQLKNMAMGTTNLQHAERVRR